MPTRSLDPYAELGIGRGASRQEAAQAHKRLAKRYHPDLHADPEATERMRRINQAWRILSDPARRARYDALHPRTAYAGFGGQATTAQHWAGRHTWTPRPPRAARPQAVAAPEERRFADSGWVALLVAAGMVLIFLAATYAGSAARGVPL